MTVQKNGREIFNDSDINNPDIDGGTADNVIIGGSTPAAGSFTTVKMTTGAAAGVVVSDVSGNLVADATPALGTPSSGTLDNCTTATASDNDADTTLASTAYAKSQDAVLSNPKAMAQGVNMTAAASGSSGITVADNDNIDFGTGNFTLVWRGSLPDWSAADTRILIKGNSNELFLGTMTGGGWRVYFQGTSYTGTITTYPVANTIHEIVCTVTRETASVAGSVSFYMDGVQYGASVTIPAGAPTTVSSGDPLYVCGSATTRIASTCSFAATYNRALTAAEVLDLYRNGIAYADKWGSQVELLSNPNFTSGDTGWTKEAGWTIVDQGGGDYEGVCTATALASIYQPNKIVAGKRYRVTYTITSLSSGSFQCACGTTDGTFRTTTGTFTEELVASGSTNAIIRSGAEATTGRIDDISFTEIGATLALEPENIGNGIWKDSTSNNLNATMPTTGWSLTRSLKNQPVLTNLLTNSLILACSGSTLENVGSDLVTNGGFDSDTSGWTAEDGCTLASIAGGESGNCLELTDTAAGYPRAYQDISSLTIGKLYKVTFSMKSGTAGDIVEAIGIKQTSGASFTPELGKAATTSSSWVSYTYTFEAPATAIRIWLGGVGISGTGSTTLFDSVTLYEVTPGYVAADAVCIDGWAKDTDLDVWREHSGSNTKAGSFYALKCTPGSGTKYLYAFGSGAGIDVTPAHLAKFAGRVVTFGCWVLTSTASAVRLDIYDGSDHWSSYHTGSGTYEWLEVTTTVDASISAFRLPIACGATAYFSQPMLVYGSSIGQGNYQPIPNEVIWLQSQLSPTSYQNASLSSALAVINLESETSGAIGKGIKAIHATLVGQATAADKTLYLGPATGRREVDIQTQVANQAIRSSGFAHCDSNGDITLGTGDSLTAIYIYINAIQT